MTCMVVADFVNRRHNYSMFRLSVDLLLIGARFHSPELPANGHSVIALFSVNSSMHFFSVNLSVIFYYYTLFEPR